MAVALLAIFLVLFPLRRLSQKVEYILAAQVLTFERYYSQRENIVKKLSSLILLSAMSVAPAAFSAPVGTLSVHILNQQTVCLHRA